jgi:hypothetical protein
VNADFDCRYRHPGPHGGVGYRGALDFHIPDWQSLSIRQDLQQLRDVKSSLRGLRIRRGEEFRVIVDRVVKQIGAVPAPQEVDEFVARDRVNPGRQRLLGSVSVSLIVNRQENFLHKVLDLIRQVRKVPTQECAQKSRELGQKLMVRLFVTGKTLRNEASETLFAQLSRILLIISLDVSNWLQAPQEKPTQLWDARRDGIYLRKTGDQRCLLRCLLGSVDDTGNRGRKCYCFPGQFSRLRGYRNERSTEPMCRGQSL